MKNQKSKNIGQKTLCFVAGKSGGHLIPAITLAQKAINTRKLFSNQDLKILFFSSNSALDNKILQNNSIITERVILNLENIPTKKSIFKKLISWPIFFYNLIISFFKSLFKLATNRPEKVISTGGYISIPVCLAAFCLRIPVELFELNTTPGKAIKFLAPFATTINVCFPKAINYLPKKKCVIAPYPIRFESSQVCCTNSTYQRTELDNSQTSDYGLSGELASEQSLLKAKTLAQYGLCPDKLTLLILGGSQGSLSINNLIKSVVKQNPHFSSKLQIIHQTGHLDNSDLGSTYDSLNFNSHVFPFDNNVQTYYNISDIVICRSGAGSLFETLFFQKKCITIPLETATTDHQVDNAIEIEKMHPEMVKMIRQKDGLVMLSLEIEKYIN